VERFAAALDLGDDVLGGGLPDERLSVDVPVLGPSADGLGEFGDAGESTPYTRNGPHDFMHNKVLITDNHLITGSYNVSANAEKNAENQLRISDDKRLVNRYATYVATIVTAYQ
jgi:phosphatidylserine/phosphatidylglycerophosphate/cardiolipin synthase-like enzyme